VLLCREKMQKFLVPLAAAGLSATVSPSDAKIISRHFSTSVDVKRLLAAVSRFKIH
jgi:hypothetical protein